MDFAIMLFIVAAMGISVLYKAQYCPEGNRNFFDINNTKAMRGLWCLIVVLVHTPAQYRNNIQDMLGSFAYIGVTFFFMTSAFGLTKKSGKEQKSVGFFWRNRLPKLLVPQLMVNVLVALLFLIFFGDQISFLYLFRIGKWVRWLLVCYFLFWAAHLLVKDPKRRKAAVCVAVVIFSAVVYCLKTVGIITDTVWTTEIYGFVWGVLLSVCYDEVKTRCNKKWLFKCVLSGCVAMGLGLMYLKCKTIVFFGDYALKIGLGLSIIAFVLILNTRINIQNKVTLFLGEVSYEVYLIHSYVFSFVSRVCEDLSSGPYILMCLVGTVLSAAVVHFISKKVLKLLYQNKWFSKCTQ